MFLHGQMTSTYVRVLVHVEDMLFGDIIYFLRQGGCVFRWFSCFHNYYKTNKYIFMNFLKWVGPDLWKKLLYSPEECVYVNIYVN